MDTDSSNISTDQEDNGDIAQETITLPIITSIWEDEYVTVIYNGKPRWKCEWCKGVFITKNATKALCHLTREKGNDIRGCSGKHLPEYAERYKLLREKSTKRCKSLKQTKLLAKRSNKIHQVELLKRKKAKIDHGENNNTIMHSMENEYKKIRQSTMDGKDESCALQIAIGDMIHSLGLPFSFAEDEKFKNVIRLAKLVPSSFKTPSRKYVSTGLLELNNNVSSNAEKEKLSTDKKTFGLSFLGDGATIAKLPYFNILAAGGWHPCSCRQIVDCSKQMATAGGKKDAEYLAKLFYPHIEELGAEETDYVVFDGASNVQKAGFLISSKYPQITTAHGIEHIASLFFCDCSKIPFVRIVCKFYKLVYGLFGSGSRHATYCIFSSYTKELNKGKTIGLIRPANTRMAGIYIALLRLLRLKAAMDQTLVSNSYLELKLKIADGVAAVLRRDAFWKLVVVMLKPFYPGLRILRLADSKQYGMDKVKYYVERANQLMDETSDDVDSLTNNNDEFGGVISMMKECTKAKYQHHFLLDDDESEEDIDENGYEYTEENAAEVAISNNKSLSEKIKHFWLEQQKKMLNPYAIASWMMSPVPEIMDHAADNHEQHHRDVVSELLIKLFLPFDNYVGTQQAYNTERSKILNQYWDEYNIFTSKIDAYDSRDFMWSSSDLDNNRSHIWHKKYSLQRTQYLGRMACIVMSKPLGIGSAERCWGEVKQLKGGQRVKLTSERVNMLTTIQGKYRAEKAEQRKRERINAGINNNIDLWDEDDIACLGLNKYGIALDVVTGENKPVRGFCAYFEDWESQLIDKKDVVVKQRFLTKYGGLKLIDLDDDNRSIHTIDQDNMYWMKGKGYKEWCLCGLLSLYDPQTNGDDWVAWALKPDENGAQGIYNCIVEYYKANPNPNIEIILEEDN